MILRGINKFLGLVKLKVVSVEQSLPADISQDVEFMEIYEFCKDYTMTSIERMYGLYKAVSYVIVNNIPGDFVECGVWRGGSSMVIARTLMKFNATNRRLHLYDTFEGMSEPTKFDMAFTGESAVKLLSEQDKGIETSVWCVASIEDVKKNIFSTGYPENNLFFIKGKVEDTLKDNLPEDISLLRLDTDWYESTKMELEKLYPILRKRGILIIDDFGHWEGAKSAVVEYFDKNKVLGYLGRLDYTGRIMIKQD